MLADWGRRIDWPKRGVTFFRATEEDRSHSGQGPRIVRVGTHALRGGAPTKFWKRLSQHKGHTAPAELIIKARFSGILSELRWHAGMDYPTHHPAGQTRAHRHGERIPDGGEEPVTAATRK
jgi:hypothetical protein